MVCASARNITLLLLISLVNRKGYASATSSSPTTENAQLSTTTASTAHLSNNPTKRVIPTLMANPVHLALEALAMSPLTVR